MTSNIAECINACLVEARELPIYDFLEEIRQMFDRWNFKNHTSASNTFTTLCGKAQEMLAENEELSLRMTVCLCFLKSVVFCISSSKMQRLYCWYDLTSF